MKQGSVIALCAIASSVHAQPPYQTDLHAWFRADAGVTVVAGEIREWADQTDNGFVFTPPAAGPELNANIVAGLPAVTFDGTTQLDGSLGTAPLARASVFAIFRYTAPESANAYAYSLGTAAASGSQMSLSRRSNDRAYHYDGALQNLSADGVIPANRWFVSAQIFGEGNPSSHDLFLNGASILRTEAANPYSADVTTCVLGNWSSGATRFVGDLVEFLVYDRALSESERSEVEGYLRERAGLPEFFKTEAEILSDWTIIQYELDAQPDAQWRFDLGGTRADQAINADASVLLSDIDVSNKVIWGELGSGSAPDFMGFVFGFQNTREFYLFDWKKATASYQDFGQARAGMRLTAFHLEGEEPAGRDFWASDIAPNTTVLRQNEIPWTDGEDYDFSLRFTPGSFVIRVWQGDAVLETWEVNDSTFTSGKFGYFINSLQDVRFGQVFAHDLQPLVVDRYEFSNDHLSLRWLGGEPPYVVEQSIDLQNWTEATGNLWNRVQVLPAVSDHEYFRVRSIGQELTDTR